VVETTTF